jgi:Uri superfamily endonuclease
VKGIYVLIVSVRRDKRIRIGSLGSVKFERGTYAYVGSAQKNMEKRLARHLKTAKKKFWHIDYLLISSETAVRSVFTREAGKEEECRLADLLGRKGRSIRGFGCSDCKCKSHLFKIREYGFLRECMKETLVRTG